MLHYYLILALIAVLAAFGVLATILFYEGICKVMANARLRAGFVPQHMQDSWSYRIVLPLLTLLDIMRAAIWLSGTFACMGLIARLWMA